MIMEDWDFTSLFLEKKEDLTDPQVHDIVVKLEKDKAIKAELDRCYSTFEWVIGSYWDSLICLNRFFFIW